MNEDLDDKLIQYPLFYLSWGNGSDDESREYFYFRRCFSLESLNNKDKWFLLYSNKNEEERIYNGEMDRIRDPRCVK